MTHAGSADGAVVINGSITGMDIKLVYVRVGSYALLGADGCNSAWFKGTLLSEAGAKWGILVPPVGAVDDTVGTAPPLVDNKPRLIDEATDVVVTRAEILASWHL